MFSATSLKKIWIHECELGVHSIAWLLIYKLVGETGPMIPDEKMWKTGSSLKCREQTHHVTYTLPVNFNLMNKIIYFEYWHLIKWLRAESHNWYYIKANRTLYSSNVALNYLLIILNNWNVHAFKLLLPQLTSIH